MNSVSLFAQSSYYTQDISTADSAAAVGAMIGVLFFMLFITVITYVVTAFLLGRIFQKAGVESWKAWVPVYSNWVFLELGGQKGYWAVLALIPLVNIVSIIFMIIAMYHISIGFGKEGAFVLIAIFLPLVWYIWLAFDKSTWKGSHPLTASTESTMRDPGTPTDPTVR